MRNTLILRALAILAVASILCVPGWAAEAAPAAVTADPNAAQPAWS